MAPTSTEDLRALVTAVVAMPAAVDDADRIERLRQFESLKSAISAAQAEVAVDFDRSQRAAAAAAGVPAARQGRGIAGQIGLALRVSPWQAQRWLGWAKIVTSELPATFALLRAGRTREWRTMIVARETAVLTSEDRAEVDREVAARLEQWGDKRVDIETRRAAYRLDPHAATVRAARAAHDRHVAIRPAPDTMTRLSALLPVTAGVAVFASLRAEADRLVGVGDRRTRGQIMADTLVERVTGQASAVAVPIEIELVMDDATLTGRSDEPAYLHGYGPVPAGWARRTAYGSDEAGPRWLRRLYTHHGRLTALDSDRRLFTAGQQRFLRHRDRTCRTPWCDAPIRHADHVQPYADGGATDVVNGQGLCEACNYARQALHWRSALDPDGTITIHTPTGHRYAGRPPDITGSPPRRVSPLERHAWTLISAA